MRGRLEKMERMEEVEREWVDEDVRGTRAVIFYRSQTEMKNSSVGNPTK